MPDNIAIKVDHVSKTFKLPHEKQNSIKGALISSFRHKGSRGFERQHVLDDISFEVKMGEFFGIVGRNGSGKSTLLKMLAGIYIPSSGMIQVNGKLTPFIELGVGFNPELTGRENVFLNGALLGFNRSEMQKMYSEIVRFAELENFMDQKLKNYSSGMQVRLAFSIATRVQSDILIFDEVLAVGDARFQQKCLDMFRKLKAEKKTIILVSHNTSDIEKFCDRVLVVDKSKSLGVMDAGDAVALYERLNIDPDTGERSGTAKRWGTGEVKIDDIVVSSKGEKTDVIKFGADLGITLHISREDAMDELPITVGLAIYDSDEVNITGPNSSNEHIVFPKGKKKISITYTVAANILNPGRYSLTTAVLDRNSERSYDHIINAAKFDVVDTKIRYGKVTFQNTSWRIDA